MKGLTFVLLLAPLLLSVHARSSKPVTLDHSGAGKRAAKDVGIHLASVSIRRYGTESFTHTSRITHSLNEIVDARSLEQINALDNNLSTSHQWLVQLKTPITDLVKARVNAHITPYALGRYLPHDTFVVFGPNSDEFKQQLAAAPSVVHVTEFEASYKVQPSVVQKVKLHQRQLLQSFDTEKNTVSSEDFIMLVTLTEELCGGRKDCMSSLSADWTSALHSLGVIEVAISPVALHVLSITCPFQHSRTSVLFLSHRPEVHWIEERQNFELSNKFAKGVVQAASSDENDTPIWDHGLTGVGQVVHVGDTGIDHDHCFFRDPSHSLPIEAVNMAHRKIVLYQSSSGNYNDQNDGHGTHVVGSLLGSSINTGSSTAEYNGMAPGAKVAFYDLMKTQGLNIPNDLYNSYYKKAYTSAGARISSNSWGADDGTYGSFAVSTDAFIYDHKDFTVLYAAGNYGDKGFHSMSSPAISKNVIAVGASRTTRAGWLELGISLGINVTSDDLSLDQVYHAVPANFGGSFTNAHIHSKLQIANAGSNGCNSLSGNYDGKAVMVQRGVCFFSDKAEHVVATGAAMMIVYNNQPGEPILMGCDSGCYSGNVPLIMISKDAGIAILTAIGSGQDVFVTGPTAYIAPSQNKNVLSSFSSRGPAWDGRFKPEIIAPGEYIISSRSDGNTNSNNCGTMRNEGTSMATPITAGAVALVRDYFTKGYYPTRTAQTSDSKNPSAALVRSLLVASGTNIGGTVLNGDQEETVEEAPSIYQGYGRVNLANILLFDDGSNNVTLWLDDDSSVATDELVSYCFKVDASAKIPSDYPRFRVTMAWTDYPSSQSAHVHIINDLDLLVHDLTNDELYIGNTHHWQGADLANRIEWDDINNLEQVSLETDVFNSGSRVFTVQVRGSNVPVGSSQQFALVLNGAGIEQLSLLDPQCQGSLICPNMCSGNGNCTAAGECACSPMYHGADCSSPVVTLASSNSDDSYALQSEEWAYFSLTVSDYEKDLVISLTRVSSTGDPDLYVSKDETQPSLTHSHYSATVDETTGSATKLVISRDDLVSSYTLGVHAYCCEAVTFHISVGTQDPEFVIPYWLIALAILAAIILGLGIYEYCRKRNQNAAGGGAVGAANGHQPVPAYSVGQITVAVPHRTAQAQAPIEMASINPTMPNAQQQPSSIVLPLGQRFAAYQPQQQHDGVASVTAQFPRDRQPSITADGRQPLMANPTRSDEA